MREAIPNWLKRQSIPENPKASQTPAIALFFLHLRFQIGKRVVRCCRRAAGSSRTAVLGFD